MSALTLRHVVHDERREQQHQQQQQQYRHEQQYQEHQPLHRHHYRSPSQFTFPPLLSIHLPSSSPSSIEINPTASSFSSMSTTFPTLSHTPDSLSNDYLSYAAWDEVSSVGFTSQSPRLPSHCTLPSLSPASAPPDPGSPFYIRGDDHSIFCATHEASQNHKHSASLGGSESLTSKQLRRFSQASTAPSPESQGWRAAASPIAASPHHSFAVHLSPLHSPRASGPTAAADDKSWPPSAGWWSPGRGARSRANASPTPSQVAESRINEGEASGGGCGGSADFLPSTSAARMDAKALRSAPCAAAEAKEKVVRREAAGALPWGGGSDVSPRLGKGPAGAEAPFLRLEEEPSGRMRPDSGWPAASSLAASPLPHLPVEDGERWRGPSLSRGASKKLHEFPHLDSPMCESEVQMMAVARRLKMEEDGGAPLPNPSRGWMTEDEGGWGLTRSPARRFPADYFDTLLDCSSSDCCSGGGSKMDGSGRFMEDSIPDPLDLNGYSRQDGSESFIACQRNPGRQPAARSMIPLRRWAGRQRPASWMEGRRGGGGAAESGGEGEGKRWKKGRKLSGQFPGSFGSSISMIDRKGFARGGYEVKRSTAGNSRPASPLHRRSGSFGIDITLSSFMPLSHFPSVEEGKRKHVSWPPPFRTTSQTSQISSSDGPSAPMVSTNQSPPTTSHHMSFFPQSSSCPPPPTHQNNVFPHLGLGDLRSSSAASPPPSLGERPKPKPLFCSSMKAFMESIAMSQW